MLIKIDSIKIAFSKLIAKKMLIKIDSKIIVYQTRF